MKLLVRLFVLAFTVVAVGAANRHVREGATGSANGTDWTNAYTTLPATLTRGDTYYIADGNYGSYHFNDAVSGITFIFIRKAVESAHGSDTGWSSTYGDGVAQFQGGASPQWRFSTGYWDIDGITGSGKTGHGFKIKANFSQGGGEKLFGTAAGTSPISNLIVAHVEMEHSGFDLNSNGGTDGVYFPASSVSDVTMRYVSIYNTERVPLFIGLGGFTSENMLFEYMWIGPNEHSTASHSECIQSTSTNIIVRYSVFENCEGTGTISLGNATNWEIYGNVFWWNDQYPQPGQSGNWSSALVVNGASQTATNIKFYNNTIIGDKHENLWGGGTLIYGTGIEITNNIYVDVNRIRHNQGVRDFNYYYNCVDCSPLGTNAQVEPASDPHPLTRGATGTSNQTNLSTNLDFTLAKSTDAGLTLASPYDTDPDGKIRGADGVWDRGAYELVTGGPEPSNTLVMDFTGTVTAIIDSSSFLPGDIAVGDAVTGTFCYTTTATDQDSTTEWGDYRFRVAPDTLVFTVEGKTWQPSSDFTLQTLIRNGSSADMIAIGLRGINMPVGLDSSENPNHSFMQLTLYDTDSSVFTNDGLPTSLTLSNFEQAIVEIVVTHNVITGAYYRVLVETISTLVER